MEQNFFGQKDLAGVSGSASRIPKVLNNRRPLTVDMIRAMRGACSIRLKSLIGAKELAA